MELRLMHKLPSALWIRRLILLLSASLASGAMSSPRQLAQEILDASALRGGVIVLIGAGDGRLALALAADDNVLVHVLDTDPAAVTGLRAQWQSLDAYGRVSADGFDGRHLPYVDRSVNLVVIHAPAAVPRAEVMRVLCPRGTALIRGGGTPSVSLGGQSWTRIVKPRPADIDDWTHYLYNASNNAVSQDRQVGPLGRLQWIGAPRYARHHDRMSSVSAAVSANGRIFSIMDEASRISVLTPPRWILTARDAFNGRRLWQRSIDRWHTHLWPLKSGPAQLPRRLVAQGDRVYVTLSIDGPLTALDAGTGTTLRTYRGTLGAEEVILSEGTLLVLSHDQAPAPEYANLKRIKSANNAPFWDEAPRRLVALRADSGQMLWQTRTRVLPLTLSADASRVVYHDGVSVVCLNRDSGQENWRSAAVVRSEIIRSFFAPTLVLYDNVVLFAGGEAAGQQRGWAGQGRDTMTALSLETGEPLWQADHPASGYRSPEDLLVAQGLVWTGQTRDGRGPGRFTGRDPFSGEVKCEFPPSVDDLYWFHHRCYRGKATENYLLMSRTGTEFIDLEKRQWVPHHWTRGACLYGVMPANGLVYNPPHPCACYLESKLYGFNALAPRGGRRIPESAADRPRLERGPAYHSVDHEREAADGENAWPTYRQDAARSGVTRAAVSAQLQPAWSTRVGSRLTGLTVAGQRVFVADMESHTVHALDAESGAPDWQFTAGARVDSPPTLHGGCVLFGCRDGWVYCLRDTDGALVWRFRAAPMDQRLLAFGQLESVWPVHGSVLALDGAVYCVAGRSMFLDGGLRLCRLDITTGRLLSETALTDRDPGTDRDLHDYVSWLNMPVALPDVLSSDGRRVYMRSQPFHLDGTRLPLKAMPHSGDADRGAPVPTQDPDRAHLFSPTGFLDDSGWHRTYWMFGSRFVSGWCGYFLAGQAAPAGRILVFDEEGVYGFGRKPQYYRWTTPIEHHLFAADPTLWTSEKPLPKKNPFSVKHRWTRDMPLYARAMVLAGGRLFVAGLPDLLDETRAFQRIDAPETLSRLKRQAAALDGKLGAVLWVVSKDAGELEAQYDLKAAPVFDGMAATPGRLYFSNTRGEVVCLADDTAATRLAAAPRTHPLVQDDPR
jgi:outer membrane protein assembly factor BamB